MSNDKVSDVTSPSPFGVALFAKALDLALRTTLVAYLRGRGFEVADGAFLVAAVRSEVARLLRPIADHLWRDLRDEARDGASEEELVGTLADIIAGRVGSEILSFDPNDPTPGGGVRSPLATLFVAVYSQSLVTHRAGDVAGHADALLAFLAERHRAVLGRARAALLASGFSSSSSERRARLHRALTLAVGQVLGDFGGGGWTAKVNKAVRQAPVELDLTWLLTVDCTLRLSGVDPATGERTLSWSRSVSGRSARASAPRGAHRVRGEVYVHARGGGISVGGRHLSDDASTRLDEGETRVEVRGSGLATVRETGRPGVVGELRAAPMELTRELAPREALEPFLLRARRGQAVTVARSLVISSPQGCLVQYAGTRIQLDPNARHTVDVSQLSGPINIVSDVCDARVSLGRPARFRRAIRVEHRGGLLRAALYVEALHTPRSAAPWRYDDLEAHARTLQFLSMRMAEGGEIEDVPDAVSLFVERLVEVEPLRPIAIIDLRRLMRARAAWAVSGSRGPATLAWADDRDDDLIPTGIAWCDEADRGLPLNFEQIASLAMEFAPAGGDESTRDQMLRSPWFWRLPCYLHRNGPEDIRFQRALADRLVALRR